MIKLGDIVTVNRAGMPDHHGKPATVIGVDAPPLLISEPSPESVMLKLALVEDETKVFNLFACHVTTG